MTDIKDLLAHTADGAYIIDEQQRIVFWNDAAQSLLGYRAEEVIGQSCFKVITGRDESGCPICRRNCIPFVDSRRGEGVTNLPIAGFLPEDARVLQADQQGIPVYDAVPELLTAAEQVASVLDRAQR